MIEDLAKKQRRLKRMLRYYSIHCIGPWTTVRQQIADIVDVPVADILHQIDTSQFTSSQIDEIYILFAMLHRCGRITKRTRLHSTIQNTLH